MAVEAIEQLCVNTLRTLSIDAIQQANSGHPGLPLGAAPMAYALWQRHLVANPSEPGWIDRDRFVLSAGHGSALNYSLLHLYGYDLPMQELRAFRQYGSRTPGHPEFGHTPGVEATTGPLGQGAANLVGMAIAERALAARFNRPDHTVIDHYTYGLISDGDIMEGVSAEAASLAGHLGLGRLICLYDSNDVSLDGPTSLTFSEDVGRRYEACGWHVQTIRDGDTDIDAIDAAIGAARADTARPSLIIVKTTIGFGSPNKAGSSASHGAPLGDDEVAATKEALGWSAPQPFHVPSEVRDHAAGLATRGQKAHAAWLERRAAYAKAHPQLDAELTRVFAGDLPDDWEAALPTFESGQTLATRSAGGKVLGALASVVPELIGGDADLSCSTKTALPDGGSFDGRSGAGRNIHFGVREHAMAAIANGIAYHGGLRPFTATFFAFVDYMRPSIRLAALNRLPIVYVFTHDSIGVGEDGPTHQPVEQLASLRSMPGVTVIRPADANEAAQAWRLALASRDWPTALVFSRQKLPVLDRSKLSGAALDKGGYILSEAAGGSPRAIVLATGSEVAVALDAQATLDQEGVPTRVVAMPCWSLFDAQDAAYREKVLPVAVSARVAVEAGVSFGWHRYIGENGALVCIDRYGASAPGNVVFEQLGLNAEAVVSKVRKLLG